MCCFTRWLLCCGLQIDFPGRNFSDNSNWNLSSNWHSSKHYCSHQMDLGIWDLVITKPILSIEKIIDTNNYNWTTTSTCGWRIIVVIYDIKLVLVIWLVQSSRYSSSFHQPLNCMCNDKSQMYTARSLIVLPWSRLWNWRRWYSLTDDSLKDL